MGTGISVEVWYVTPVPVIVPYFGHLFNFTTFFTIKEFFAKGFY